MALPAGVIRPAETSTKMDTQNSDAVNITGGAMTSVTLTDNTTVLGGTTVTPVAAEFNTLTGLPASVATATTPASGTCAVQFTFKNSAGVAINRAFAGQAYFSNSTGLAIAAATSGATLTNGAWLDVVAGSLGQFITSAAGLLGVTVTAGAGTYYLTFILPNGKIVTSTAIVVN